MRLEDEKFVASLQNEIENLALETAGTAEHIYFDKVIVNDEFYFEFDPDINAWVLHRRLLFET